MAIDKALYQAPTGLPEAQVEDDTPIDVVEDDGEGGVIVTFGEEVTLASEFGANLAESMTDAELGSLASELLAEVEADEQARREWLETYVKGLELLGLKYENRSEPWQGACGVTHPLLMESAVKFQAETIMETFPAQGPVRAKIIGKDTQEKKDAALRVEEDMNYRLTETMVEYRPEHERLLLTLPLAGNAFKKVYRDENLGREVAIYIPAEDIIVPYGASSLEQAERVTHRMRKTKQELLRLQRGGFYRDVEMGDPVQILDEVEKAKAKEQGYSANVIDKRFQIYEIHCLIDLPGYEDKDGVALPYVVTIEKGTGTVLAVYRNWKEDDEKKLKRNHFVHYGFVPGFGFYSFGLIHLIGGHTKTATSLLRQLVDAGTLANLPGGFKARGMRIKGDTSPVGPGEWLDVDLPSGTIKDNILPLPYKEPSQTLLALMDRVIEDARRYASVADLKVSDMSAQAPVGTTLAVLERMLKVMSAVQARIHYSMKQEFKLLKNIIRENAPEEYSYEPDVGNRTAKASDYDMVDVIPVSDPNAATMSQRVVQYQAIMQLAGSAPQLYDLPFLHRQMIEVLGIKNAKKIVPTVEDMKPIDPVSENMAILNGKPVKAFIWQDHQAHLGVHMAAMQDPKLMEIMGQNPNAQAIQAAAMAHVMEHVAFQYRREIEGQLGAALPPPPEQASGDEESENILPPMMEVELSRLVAQAAQKLLGKNTQEAAAQQAQAAAQDPVMQMQQMDLQIKQGELQRKMQKDVLDAAAKADAQKLREQEVMGRQQLDALRIMTQAAKDEDQLNMQDEAEAAKVLLDIAKTHGAQQQQREALHTNASLKAQQQASKPPAKGDKK